jgi:hypothetical protein
LTLSTLTGNENLTRTDLVAVAEGVHQRPDGQGGWTVAALTHCFVPYSDGWDTAGPLRESRWVTPDGTLHGEPVYGNVIDQLQNIVLHGKPTVRTIGDRTVYVQTDADKTSMFWRESDGVFAEFASPDQPRRRNPRRHRNHHRQPNQMGRPTPRAAPTSDGCDSLFC